MSVEWDERKRRRNLDQHGVDFADAALIFEGPVLESEDARRGDGEARIRAFAEVDGVGFPVVYSWRGGPGAAASGVSSAHGR